jgi:hypothetical protein
MNKWVWIVGGMVLMGEPKYLETNLSHCQLVVWSWMEPEPCGERSAIIHTMAQAKYSIHNKCVCMLVCVQFSVRFSYLLRRFQV